MVKFIKIDLVPCNFYRKTLDISIYYQYLYTIKWILFKFKRIPHPHVLLSTSYNCIMHIDFYVRNIPFSSVIFLN